MRVDERERSGVGLVWYGGMALCDISDIYKERRAKKHGRRKGGRKRRKTGGGEHKQTEEGGIKEPALIGAQRSFLYQSHDRRVGLFLFLFFFLLISTPPECDGWNC
jgi:hypothetical protein